MTDKNKEFREEDAIDILYLVKAVLHRFWLVLVCGIVGAGIGFGIAKYAITPLYSSQIMLYVNNSSISVGTTSFSISSSDISASQSLVKTYGVILKNRTTMEMVIEKAQLPYTYSQLSGMVQASSVNDTEVMGIKVTCPDPYEAAKIANCIAEVLPQRISEIIDGATMEVVDSGIANLNKVSPSVTRYTAIGLLLGAFFACAVIVILALLDDTIHDEDYILQTYDYPILAKIPDLLDSGSKKYGYYSEHSV